MKWAWAGGAMCSMCVASGWTGPLPAPVALVINCHQQGRLAGSMAFRAIQSSRALGAMAAPGLWQQEPLHWPCSPAAV